MRAVYEDDVIKMLNEGWIKGIYPSTANVRNLPTAKLHWIPVEQDLPKIGEYVLCETTRYFGKHHVCKFVDKDEWIDRPHFDWDRNGVPRVIAWARFEPYKGVTE